MFLIFQKNLICIMQTLNSNVIEDKAVPETEILDLIHHLI